jgi:hypothetical protein
MPKAEISWKRTTDEGATLQVYVRHTGGQYRFYSRHRRYDRWETVEHPPLEDWLELLDCVERRIQRRKLRPEEADRVRRCIRERFPEHPLAAVPES